MKKKIGNFELVDHGIDGSQYFQGCGTSFTEFEHVTTGCGDTPAEAFDDLMDMVAQYGATTGEPTTLVGDDGVEYVNPDAWYSFDTEGLEKRILKAEGIKKFPNKPSAYNECLKANGLDDENEPDRLHYETDEAFEKDHETWESEKESLECDNYYYMSLRWCEK